MIDFIADNFYYVFLGWIILSLVQRRYRGRGDKKRTATLIQSILIFILYIGAMLIREEGFEKKWIVIPFAVIAVVLYFFRSKVIPYELKCRNCGAKLTMNQIFLYDANLCTDCDPDEKVSDDSPVEEDEESEDTDNAELSEDQEIVQESDELEEENK